LGLEPGFEVVGDGLAVVDVDRGAFAGQYSVEGGAGVGLGGVAAAAQGLAVVVEGG
jgi:hypothetical protein